MKALTDLVGQRFGILVAVTRELHNHRTYWKCKCDCGNEITCRQDALKCGANISCGCKKIKQHLSLTYDGRTQSFREWSRDTGISIAALRHRAGRGWPIEETFSRVSKAGMPKGTKIPDGQVWSQKWPGYLECKNGLFRMPGVTKNGNRKNVYKCETKCDNCGIDCLVDRNNNKKSKLRFCSKSCQFESVKKRSFGNKNKKKRRGEQGHYVTVKTHGHPRATNNNNVLEHILVKEKEIGRYLLPKERVHHINFVKSDNSPSNLLLCSSDSDHSTVHRTLNHCVNDLLKLSAIYFDHEERRYRVNYDLLGQSI